MCRRFNIMSCWPFRHMITGQNTLCARFYVNSLCDLICSHAPSASVMIVSQWSADYQLTFILIDWLVGSPDTGTIVEPTVRSIFVWWIRKLIIHEIISLLFINLVIFWRDNQVIDMKVESILIQKWLWSGLIIAIQDAFRSIWSSSTGCSKALSCDETVNSSYCWNVGTR